MFVLAHTGIPLAIARGIEKIMVRRGIRKLPELIDYRLVLVGSMLPDIIDKPLGGLVFREALGSGRTYCHTVLFLVVLLVIGMIFWYKYGRPGFLVLAGGSLAHHVLDGMWLFPATFLWPAYGWAFPQGVGEDWLAHWVKALLTDPYVYVPEIIGGLLLVLCGAELVCKKKVKIFPLCRKA